MAAGSAFQSSMPKLSIELNSRVQIRMNLMSSQSRMLQGEFLGVQHYDFFMVRIPSAPGIRNLLLPHTVVEIRYSIEGAVHSFRTEIISHVIKPTLILFLTYPDRMSIIEMRKSQRCACALPVFLHSPKGDGNGIIADISSGGCQVCFPLSGNSALRSLEKEERVVIQTVFAADGSTASATGIIKKTEILSGNMALGVAFEEMHSDFAKNVTKYCGYIQELAL